LAFRCYPVGIAELEISVLGNLSYLKIEFLKTSRCSGFSKSVKKIVSAQSLGTLLLNDDDYAKALIHFGDDLLNIDTPYRRYGIDTGDIHIIKLLSKMKLSTNCQTGVIEFR
jgi:hypothetical protein